LPPPMEWLDKRRVEIQKASGAIPHDDTLLDEWRGLTSFKRAGQMKAIRQKQRRLHLAKEQVNRGTASVRTQNMVANCGYRQYDDQHAASAGYAVTSKAKRDRRSKAYLEMLQQRSSGCSIQGCPLNGSRLHKLLHDDHVRREDKSGCTSQLIGTALLEELPKVERVCRWHHFERTREQLRWRSIDEIEESHPAHASTQLRQMKQSSGCVFPIHSLMPYASLIPNSCDDRRRYGFMEVSHTDRRAVGGRSFTAMLRDLNSAPPRAAVLCSFCHGLWTLCEQASIQAARGRCSPFTVAQMDELRSTDAGRKFLQAFKERTQSVDWVQIAKHESDAMSRGQKRRAETAVQNERSKQSINVS
jgi:hypothetical protein